MSLPQLMRVATRNGVTVHWQNVVGGYLGQSGTFVFETEVQAEDFVAYATQDGAPSLADDVLAEKGFPPISKTM